MDAKNALERVAVLVDAGVITKQNLNGAVNVESLQAALVEQAKRARRAEQDCADLATRVAELEQYVAKLESLGPWLEANRLAQLKWAEESRLRGDVNCREQGALFEARADAFKQAGYELIYRAGKDLRGGTSTNGR